MSIDWLHVGQDRDNRLAPINMAMYSSSLSNRLNVVPFTVAVPSKAVGYWLLACWDSMFESRLKHGYLSLEFLCVVKQSLCDEVLPTVVCLSVISKPKK